MTGMTTKAELTTVLVGVMLFFPNCTSFLIYPRYSTFSQRQLTSPLSRVIVSPSFSTTPTRTRHYRPLFVNFNSNDPFQILGMDEPSTDKKVIKRAYKRMALQYHPDVATTKDSSPEEKKRASDRFAKINWAHDVLTGKRENDSTYATGSTKNSAGSSSSSSSSSSWAPPHRRSGSSYSTSTSPSGSNADGVDWTDFMPKVDNEEYNVDGDSFSKILSDLFVGAATGAAGLGGPNVFRDFIDFLEGNVDGFGGSDDDAELRIMLQTGSLDEVRNELDDTELVVQQLNAKLRGIKDEVMTLTTQATMTTRYLEKMELEESLAELNARKEVVEGYVKKAQKRLLSLQTRYKELLTTGGTRDPYSTRSSSSWQDIKNEATSSNGSKSTTASSSFTSQPPSAAQRSASNENDAWMNESFGSSSYGRGRGEGRRRSRSRSPSSSPSTSSEPDVASSSPRDAAPRAQESRYSSSAPYTGSSRSNASVASTTSSSSAIRNVATDVPPHRRTSGSYENQQEKDKRRLRELKVDEEFDKLKKELGL